MDNPDITASDIVTDVENRLDNPNISTSKYLPWVSYAYQKTYQALVNCGQRVKEEFFGNYEDFNLNAGVTEYNLKTYIPRYGGMIKVEIKYGGTSDQWTIANKINSLGNVRPQQDNVDDNFSKGLPGYYLIQDTIGFRPTPSTDDSGTPQVRIWYIKRPFQITAGTDIIDIPYRFIYPIADYVQAKAIMSENEDYSQAAQTEANFRLQLQELQEAVVSEFDENDGTNAIQVSSSSGLFHNPFRR